MKGALVSKKRETYKKYKKLYSKCLHEKKHSSFTSKRFSQLKIDNWKWLKISIKDAPALIDQRISNVSKDNHFDEFVRISLPYQTTSGCQRHPCLTVKVPVKGTRISQKYSSWDVKRTMRLERSGKSLMLVKFYEHKAFENKLTGSSI